MKKVIFYLPLLLPMVFFLPWLGSFPYPSAEAPYSDFSLSHYPAYLYLQREILEHGQIPLWYPGILSGTPTIANPLSGISYPPGWAAIFLPLPAGLNLLTALHLVFGGMGMYLLLRKTGLQRNTALFGALSFQLLPKVYAHYGAGHLTLVWAMCWTPWLLVAQVTPRKFFRPGVILAMIFLCDVRWGVYAGLLWLAWGLNSQRGFLKAWRGWAHWMRQAIREGFISIGLAAPFLLPFLEYTSRSTRVNLAPGERLAFSLPIERIPGSLFPALSGNHEWVIYPGIVIFTLMSIGFVVKGSRGEVYWYLVLGFSLLIALGDRLPGMEYLTAIPPFSLLRVPSRSLFLFGLSGIVLAAHSLEHVVNNWNKAVGNQIARLIPFQVIIIALPAVIIGGILVDLRGEFLLIALISILVSASLAAFCFLQVNKSRQFAPVMIGLLVVFSLVDFLAVSFPGFISPRDSARVLRESEGVIKFLANAGSGYRVYSPSASIPQQMAAFYELELADGVDPLQLEGYRNFMAQATGIPMPGYSVTLPPFNGDPRTANNGYQPDLQKLGWLDVRYIASAFPMDADGLTLISFIENTWIYANKYSRPRAWVQEGFKVSDAYVPATEINLTPNRILIMAEGPGILVLSEIYYPGWKAKVDGNGIEILPIEQVLRGVELTPGLHQVEFYYEPRSIQAGFGILAITAVMLFWRRHGTVS